MLIEDFIEKFPPRLPRIRPRNDDELRKLTSADGIRFLQNTPPEIERRHVPKMTGDKGCHLWVIDRRGVPFLLETALISPPLETGKVKHTNLTGGEAASSGGEVWFHPAEEETIFINGRSGRYGPETPEELDNIVECFEAFDYRVI